MNSRITRRTFVQASCKAASLASAGIFGTRRLAAQPLLVRSATASLSPDTLLSDPTTSSHLRHLATSAIAAATQAGAGYADVRCGEQHRLYLSWSNRVELGVSIESTFTYGIRAMVDGAWAFTHGSEPTADAVAASARDAVTMAKTYRPFVVHRGELAPSPVVTGEWATPVKIDPFEVPLREHHAMLDSYDQLRRRVPQPKAMLAPGLKCDWTRETRVFASSDGSLTTQQLRGVYPSIGAAAAYNGAWMTLALVPWVAASGGYELLADPTRYETEYLAVAETVARYLYLPAMIMDVGRYPIVLDGASTAALVGNTIGPALELDRVLGDEAGASGTSYLSPPLELLGTTIASPKLSITATRALPTACAVQWDDEGVAPHEYPVITEGRLVDYHTTRATAPALASWYATQRQPMRSHGCATVTEASRPVMLRAPHLRMAAGSSASSVETLYKDVKEGIFVTGAGKFESDQQFASGMIVAKNAGDLQNGALLKIERGKLVGRIVKNGLELFTKKLWKEQLMALGDERTVQPRDIEISKGMPWRSAPHSVSAPAAFFKDVNVIGFPSQ